MIKRLKKYTFIFFGLITITGFGQSNYFKKNLKNLTHKKMSGRGYTSDGMKKASEYLALEFKKNGLKQFNATYLHETSLPINIIEAANLKIDGKDLVYGKDFIVKPSSKSVQNSNEYQLYHFPTIDYLKSFESKENLISFLSDQKIHQNNNNIILPPLTSKVDSIKNYYKQWSNLYENENNEGKAFFRFTADSLTSSLSQRQANVTEFIIKDKYYSENVRIDDFHLKVNFNSDFKFNNVIGYIDGENNDSVIVVTAHYDHLGRVGESYFPGASDNASGTAMVLELARYYAKNKPKYKTVFMLFGAEEAGIVGALKYVENPLFPLSKIKFLVNLDIMGAGEDGIQVVNGTKHKKQFDELVQINQRNNFVKEVKIRGESCNSDHCPFDKKGVPAFFIYTLGGKGNYHNVYDTYQNLDLSHVDAVKKLLINFVDSL